jgi:hypothetical protein
MIPPPLSGQVRRGQRPADRLRGGEASALGHMNVQEAQVGSLPQSRLHGLGAGGCFGADLEPSPFEVMPERAADHRVIVCNQDSQWSRWCLYPLSVPATGRRPQAAMRSDA